VSLYTAETRRLVKRRFTKIFVIGAVLALIAIGVGMFATNHKVAGAQIAAARAKATANYQQAQRGYAQEKARCGTDETSPDCQGLVEPTPDNFDPQWYLPATFEFRGSFPDLVTTLAALLAVVGFVVGASYVGAEWSSGGMMNLLLWRPQRVRVLATKLGALLGGMTALTVALMAVWTAAFVGIAHLRGTMAGMTSGAWQSIGIMEARGLVLVLVVTAIGFGLASIGRHTAMAMGVAIGLVVVFQFGLGTVLSLAKVKFPEAYLLPYWAIAWMKKTLEIQDNNSCDFSATNGCQPDTLTITWQMAGALLAVSFVAIVGAALWTVRRRDVT
jgi:hypothetical protein